MIEQPTLFEMSATERILKHFEENHKAYIANLRAVAVEFARRSSSQRVSIDDVHREIARLQIPTPAQIGVTKRIFGSVLRGCKELRSVDSTLTDRAERVKRAGIGGSMIAVYALRERV